MSTLGSRIKEARIARGMSQAALVSALKKETGKGSQGLISQLEGDINSETVLLPAIARILGVSVDWLDTGKAQEPPRAADQQPSLAELFKRFAIALQAAQPSTQAMAADALARWAKAPHRWGQLIEQLGLLNIDIGKAEPDPRFALTRTKTGEVAALVSEDALAFAEIFTRLDGRMEAGAIFSDVYQALIDSKQRHGLTKWPDRDERRVDHPVENDRRVNKEDTPPMTTADRLRLRESALHGWPPIE